MYATDRSEPADLVLARHGRSEPGPGAGRRLDAQGRAQARAAGQWLNGVFAEGGRYSPDTRFDRFCVSPRARAQESAALMGLSGARWSLDRALREPDRGPCPDAPYRDGGAGESAAQVAEDRVANILATLHRECPRKRVAMVTHGGTLEAFRIVLESLSDEEARDMARAPGAGTADGEVLHYSRIDPRTGVEAPWLRWLRRARPARGADGGWAMEAGGWREIAFRSYTDAELLARIGG